MIITKQRLILNLIMILNVPNDYYLNKLNSDFLSFYVELFSSRLLFFQFMISCQN